MPERGMRRLRWQLRDEQQVLGALIPLVASTSQAASRHFTDRPLVDEANDETYVVYQMWGT